MNSERFEKVLEIIYRMLMNNYVLNDTSFMRAGISEEEEAYLIQNGIIEPLDNGNYKLLAIEGFRLYGVKLLNERRIGEANVCFRSCYDLAPNDREVCLQVLLAAIKKIDYRRAFEFFGKLEKIDDDNFLDNNLILYLLNIIADCPLEYADRAKNMEREDIMLPNEACNKKENEVRAAIWSGKFTYATGLLNTIMSKLSNYSVRYELIKGLLLGAIHYDRYLKVFFLNNIKENNYYDVVAMLKKLREKRYLTSYETYMLIMAEAIIKVKETGNIPVPTINFTSDLYEALINNNFSLAYEINMEFIEHINGDASEDAFNLMLTYLNELINNIKVKIEDSGEDVSLVDESCNDEVTKVMQEAEEMAYFVFESGDSFEVAKRKYGLTSDAVLLIKLIYIRDCYLKGTYEEVIKADMMMNEVEASLSLSELLVSVINRVKSFRKLDSVKRILKNNP